MSPAHCILPTQDNRDPSETGNQSVDLYSVASHNRWSRVTLNFRDVQPNTWCELSFHIDWDVLEENKSVPDFISVGVDFLTEDGSSIDFSQVPGLARTQIDPHSCYVGGLDKFGSVGHSGRISCGFYVPAPAKNLNVTIRSWRNSHPFVIRKPRLLQISPSDLSDKPTHNQSQHHLPAPLSPRRMWRSLGTQPLWFKYALAPRQRLMIRGQLVNESLEPQGAFARIIFRDGRGSELQPPYPEISAAPSVGAFIDLPLHRQSRRFTLDLIPPPEAASVEIGFQTWNNHEGVELVMPLEISLDDDFLLEAIVGEDLPDAPAFLHRVLQRLGLAEQVIASLSAPALLKPWIDPKAFAKTHTVHDKLVAIARGTKSITADNKLSLGTLPSWNLPEVPSWREDPFQSLAWRLEFQSLLWLVDLAEKDNGDGLGQATDLAVSWSRANPWSQPTDPISAHPRALSSRTDALLILLSASVKKPKAIGIQKIAVIFSELIRHAFALAQLLSQNVFSHSNVRLHAASSLLGLARALPRFPLSSFWASLALAHLRDGFLELIDEDGVFLEHSMHLRLELVSLGTVLIRELESLSEADDFRLSFAKRLRIGLRRLVAATDPSGSMPPFGDAPQGVHHASWLRRLLSGYGTSLLSDPELAAELAYPAGFKVYPSAEAGLITLRNYERNANWSYFCTSLGGYRQEQDHFDCTSFVYATAGKPWIVDSRGSNLHDIGVARQYLVSARAHNVSLPDEREQLVGMGWIEAHETYGEFHTFVIGTNVYGAEYRHRRVIACHADLQAIAVFDHFSTPSPTMSFEGLLHFDKEIVVALANTQLGVAYRNKERLRIVPSAFSGQFTGMSVENGRNDRPAAIQGFVACPTGGLEPANVLRYRFSGQGTVYGGVLLGADDRALRSLSQFFEGMAEKLIVGKASA